MRWNLAAKCDLRETYFVNNWLEATLYTHKDYIFDVLESLWESTDFKHT